MKQTESNKLKQTKYCKKKKRRKDQFLNINRKQNDNVLEQYQKEIPLSTANHLSNRAI